MKDYMKLVDGTQITIEDGASLDRIIHIAESDAEAASVCRKVTNDNVRHVEFWKGGPEADAPYGVFDDLVVATPAVIQISGEGIASVLIRLREKTSVELRLDALEESQETQDGAIADIGQVLSDMVEA